MIRVRPGPVDSIYFSPVVRLTPKPPHLLVQRHHRPHHAGSDVIGATLKLDAFMTTMAKKFPLIRHVVFSHRDAMNIFFTPSPAWVLWCQEQCDRPSCHRRLGGYRVGLTRSEDCKDVNWALMRLRKCLTHLTSLTVIDRSKWGSGRSLADGMVQLLSWPDNPPRLAGFFPLLGDIRADETARGRSERFRKTDSGEWQRWYSKEALPKKPDDKVWIPQAWRSSMRCGKIGEIVTTMCCYCGEKAEWKDVCLL